MSDVLFSLVASRTKERTIRYLLDDVAVCVSLHLVLALTVFIDPGDGFINLYYCYFWQIKIAEIGLCV